MQIEVASAQFPLFVSTEVRIKKASTPLLCEKQSASGIFRTSGEMSFVRQKLEFN